VQTNSYTRPMLALLLAAQAALPAPPAKGTPPLTEQTRRSGGPIDAEQAKLRFETADLSFEVLPDRYRLEGRAALTFTATALLTLLRLDLDRNLPVTAVSIDGRALAPGAWSNPQGRLDIRLPAPVAAGHRLVVTVTYGGVPHVAVRAPWDDGVVWAKTPDGRPWFATTAQGFGCDLFWPCLDFPRGEPGQVTLHITVPAGLKAPSNGVLLSVDRLADGRTRWNWRTQHPNTYAIALNVGPYEELSGRYRSRYGNTIPMQYWYLPGERAKAEKLFAEFAPTLDFFEANVGPYPFGDEKVGVVQAPHKGMEHQTINAYGNEYAKAPEGFDWLFQHEFAHEWFGNQLTAADWDDFWLHEGYGTYMQPAYGRWREGEARYDAMMLASRAGIRNERPIVSGASRTEEQVYEPSQGGPGQDIYNKGAWTLHTLRWLIGDAAFWRVTRLAVYGRADPKPGNFAPRFGTTAEYQALVAQVTGRDFRWFFDAYLRRAPLPELVERRAGDRLTLEWRAGGPFPMPLDVEIDGRVRRVDMTGGRATIDLPAAAHLVIDPGARVLRRSTAIEEYQAWQKKQNPKP